MRVNTPGSPIRKLEQFIDNNFDDLSQMGDDVYHLHGDEIEKELGYGTKPYLQSSTSGSDPFRYKGFVIYYIDDTDEVYIELNI
jgi:hypothetical protein